MLNKIFNKTENPQNAQAAQAEAEARTAAELAAARQLWEGKLQAAMGNDDALLMLATEAPVAEIKLAAIQALTGEAALKRAEREFRERDRRIYREAKQQHEALIKQRETREQASKLLESAEILIHAANIPSNRLVELDRAWQALDSQCLEEAQLTRFSELWETLSKLVRERGDQQQLLTRWLQDASRAVAQIDTLCNDVLLETAEVSALQAAHDSITALLDTTPVVSGNPAVNNTRQELQDAAHNAAGITTRLALLAELHAAAQSKSEADYPPLIARWTALPSLPNAQFAQNLDARFALWLRAQTHAEETRHAEVQKLARAETKAAQQAQIDALTTQISAAETSLAEGHLADTARQLGAIDNALKGIHLEGKLQTRLEKLQAEYARLRGWQHWSGGMARDDLVKAAEELAGASAAEVSKAAAKEGVKIPIKALADAIEQLRERWKELDKLGAAGGKSKWQRFDAALKTAFVPVGVHLDKLKAQRKENLAARNALVAELDAITLSDASKDETQDWRALARSLEHFHNEWRKLGPLEHTVSRKAQPALLERMKAALARLEAPLEDVRRVEQLKRSKLIERAKALHTDAQGRDTVAKVRDLQTEWQKQAKGIPLARNVENTLWSDFKSAIDNVFATRDAANNARDAGLKANQTTREALIARLTALAADTAAADIKRTLFEADSEWRKAGEAPKNVAAKLESQYRAARETAQKYLAGSALRIWHATCDALNAKLALCAEIENGAEADIERWNGLAPTLPLWDKVLQARFEKTPRTPSADAIENTLLQLESALDIESPPAFQAARRDLKLRAMKAAIEARQTVTISNSDIQQWIADVISVNGLDTVSDKRLAAILVALRNKSLR